MRSYVLGSIQGLEDLKNLLRQVKGGDGKHSLIVRPSQSRRDKNLAFLMSKWREVKKMARDLGFSISNKKEGMEFLPP